jgi:hypothetical protein
MVVPVFRIAPIDHAAADHRAVDLDAALDGAWHAVTSALLADLR